MTFQVRYTKATNHIQGLEEATAASADGMDYAVSACGSLSRSGSRMAVGKSTEDLNEALEDARKGDRKLCKNCEKAALRVLEAIAETADILSDDVAMETIDDHAASVAKMRANIAAEDEARAAARRARNRTNYAPAIEADESAETTAGKSNVVGNAVSAMIDQDAPNRIRFDADESTVDALVTRDAPGMAYVNIGTAEISVAAIRRIRNRYELISSSGDIIRAGSIAKAVKRWAKRTGITVNRIETVKQF